MTDTKTEEEKTTAKAVKTKNIDAPEPIRKLFAAGAHYGNRRSRRHPSTEKYIFGVKNTVEIFDLDKTQEALEKASEFVQSLGEGSRQVLFVSGKREAREPLLKAAKETDMPYVTGRWVGGALTNFKEIRKRVDLLEELQEKKESGALDKYTKHEQLLFTREIEALERKFGGIIEMRKLPSALVVVDPSHEEIAVEEALQKNIPVVALANSDCDISDIAYPIPGNDASKETISLVLEVLTESYKKCKESGGAKQTAKPKDKSEK